VLEAQDATVADRGFQGGPAAWKWARKKVTVGQPWRPWRLGGSLVLIPFGSRLAADTYADRAIALSGTTWKFRKMVQDDSGDRHSVHVGMEALWR
jgi:hypothetical protein